MELIGCIQPGLVNFSGRHDDVGSKFDQQVVEVRNRYALTDLKVDYNIVGHPYDFTENYVALGGTLDADWLKMRSDVAVGWWMLFPSWKTIRIKDANNPGQTMFCDPPSHRYMVTLDLLELPMGKEVRSVIVAETKRLIRPFVDDILQGGAAIIKEAHGGGKRWEEWK